ncbi:MAG: RNA 2',3'-cyclic phosphodiesterase [Rhodanobacteraceae bacterium]
MTRCMAIRPDIASREPGGSRAIDRLFFAVFPDGDTAARIVHLASSLRDRLGLKGKPIRAERLHATLHFLGNYAGLPPDLVTSAIAAARRVEYPAFDVAFDRVGSFPGRRNRPLVLRDIAEVTAFGELEQALVGQLELAGIARVEDRPFTPHLTMLYDEKTIASRSVEQIGWRVREFVLVHSLVDRGDYRILGRRELKDS